MEHYQVILAYDGAHYKGFQRQANARTVQAVVEEALRKLSWQGKSITAAGRTDTGAHATGQVIAFELKWEHGLQDLQTALNSYLPKDVVAQQVRQVSSAFHPRHDASWRKYLYRVYCQPVRDPLVEPYAWRVWPAVDINLLYEAAQRLVGKHDFGAFGTPPQPEGTTTRTVLQAGWEHEAPYYVFAITAQAFLYHMVRRLVHMQVKIGQRKLIVDDLQLALDTGRDISACGGSEQSSTSRLVHGLAPARGLILAEVHYPPEVLQLGEDGK